MGDEIPDSSPKQQNPEPISSSLQGLQSQHTKVQKANLDLGAAEIKGWVVISLQHDYKTTL